MAWIELALAVQHQPTQIQLTLGPLITPREARRPDLIHLLRSHSTTRSHTASHPHARPNKALLAGGRASGRRSEGPPSLR
jgi:hypothetical protein